MKDLKKQPIIESSGKTGCLKCSPYPQTQLSEDARIAVGFGLAQLTCNGEEIWAEDNHEYEDCMTVSEADVIASERPDEDWRIVLYGPLRGRVYQRHGELQWMLIEENKGSV